MPALTYLASLITRMAASHRCWRSRFLEHGAGRLLDHLLVAPLDRAVALVEVQDVALLVGEDLDLHVPGLDDELFEIDVAVAEGGLGLGLGRIERRPQADVVVDDPHAAAAAAGDGLDDDRVADLVGELHRLGLVGDGAFGARDDGDLGLAGDLAGLDLVAQQPHGLDAGADEADAAVAADLREVGVLGEEPVAGVDRIDVGDLRGADDPGDVQVALVAVGRPDADRLVGQPQVGGVAVRLRVDGDRLNPQLVAGANDAKGDLTAIGDKDSG